MRQLVIYIFMLFIIMGCSRKDENQPGDNNFADLYGGNPYKGSVTGIRSEGGNQTHRWEGDGRIVLIEPTADSVSLVVMADFRDIGEVNLKFRGAYNHNSFHAESDHITFQINNQKITGIIANTDQKMSFDGTLTTEQSKLIMTIEFIQGQEGFPPGSTLEVIFDTSRKISDDDEGGCNMRMVPILGPSGMTMGMVPDC